jgi:uncharacterized protein (DUF4415 family)
MRKSYDFSKAKPGPAIASPGKTRITIMLDNDLLEAFRAKAESQGSGYQTLINEALRVALATPHADAKPLTAATLRRILREELRAEAV